MLPMAVARSSSDDIIIYDIIITFRVSRRPREMYCGHARLCVCVCVSVCVSVRGRMPTLLHGPGCKLGSGRGCLLMCTIGRICNRCTGCVAMATLWQCVAEPSGNPPGPRRRLPSPAIKWTRLLRAPFHFVHTPGVL